MDIREKVRNYINENLTNFNETTFSDEDDIFSLGFVNSLFAMKLISYIEKEFELEIEFEEMELRNFNSVLNIVRFIENKRAA